MSAAFGCAVAGFAGTGTVPLLEALPPGAGDVWPNDETASAVAETNTVTIREVFIGRILLDAPRERQARVRVYQPRTFANTSGATMVASDSIINRGVVERSLPHVIFSFGTAPEYDPKLVVESLIWQK